MKNTVMRIKTLSAALLMTAVFLLAGCSDILNSPATPEIETDEGGIRISIADGIAGARTILPQDPDFTFSRYRLTFNSGTAGSTAVGHDPIDMKPGETTTVTLPAGDWIINAEAYRATDDTANGELMARGSYTMEKYTPENGIMNIEIPISMIMDKTKQGSFQLKNVPMEEIYSGTLTITEFPKVEGKAPTVYNLAGADFSIDKPIALNAGYYWIEIEALSVYNVSEVYRDIVHIYPYCVSLLDFDNAGGGGGTDPVEGYAVNVEYDSYGSIRLDNPAYRYKEGETVTIYVQPVNGYKLASLNAYEKSADGGTILITSRGYDAYGYDTYTFTMPASDVYVYAEFESTGGVDPSGYYTVYSTIYGDGKLTFDSNTSRYPEKANVIMTVQPDEGYKLSSLSAYIKTEWGTSPVAEFPVYESGGSYTFTMPASDVYVDVYFVSTGGGGDPAGYYNVSSQTNGYGSIRFDSTTNRYPEKATVTMYVQPSEGYQLSALIVSGKSVNGVNESIQWSPVAGYTDRYTFTMPASDVTVNAYFVSTGGGDPSRTYPVDTVYNSEYGVVGLSADNNTNLYPAGATVTMHVQAYQGYELSNLYAYWKSADGESGTIVCNPVTGYTNVYTFTMPASDVTVVADFVSTGGGGTDPGISYQVTLDQSYFTFEVGKEETFTITATVYPADAAYRLEWTTDTGIVNLISKSTSTTDGINTATFATTGVTGSDSIKVYINGVDSNAKCIVDVIDPNSGNGNGGTGNGGSDLSVSLSPFAIDAKAGEAGTYTLIASVSPEGAAYENIRWDSSNIDVASVTGNGTTAVVTTTGKAGFAVVHVYITDDIFAKCTFNVAE